MAVFEGSLRTEAGSIMGRYPEAHRRSAIMPLLYLAQSVDGWVTRDALREIGELLGITTAEVEAVASFYTMYRLRPTGTHVINVCTNLACKLRGAKDVFEAAHEAAGVAHGAEMSEDGLFTVHEEECLGVCDFAPAVQIDLCNHDTVDAVLPPGPLPFPPLAPPPPPPPPPGPAFGSFKAASRALAGLEEVPSA
jgi:NADH:ubiquinone oxidoreductase subunit E